jgi:hypothetical protein
MLVVQGATKASAACSKTFSKMSLPVIRRTDLDGVQVFTVGVEQSYES